MELLFTRQKVILPVMMSTHKFLYALGLKSNRNLRNVEDSWICLDQLFDRFGHLEGIDLYHDDFQCDRKIWENLRPLNFSLAF